VGQAHPMREQHRDRQEDDNDDAGGMDGSEHGKSEYPRAVDSPACARLQL
jgi:hypothetical protein